MHLLDKNRLRKTGTYRLPFSIVYGYELVWEYTYDPRQWFCRNLKEREYPERLSTNFDELRGDLKTANVSLEEPTDLRTGEVQGATVPDVEVSQISSLSNAVYISMFIQERESQFSMLWGDAIY